MSNLCAGILNYIHLFFLLFFVQGLCAMEKEIKIPIAKPTHVAFLHNNIVAIAGLNGFCFFDTKKNEAVHFQQDQMIEDFCIHCEKTKIATSSKGIIQVYNVYKQELQWEYNTNQTKFVPITFNSHEKDDVFAHVFPHSLYHLQNGKSLKCNITFDHEQTYYPILYNYRTKRVVHIASTLNKTGNVLCWCGTREDSLDEEKRLIGNDSSFATYQFLFDGERMIINVDGVLRVLNIKDNRFIIGIPQFNNVGFALNRSETVLATLSRGNKLRYWNFDNYKITQITKVSLDKKETKDQEDTTKDEDGTKDQNSTSTRLAFSPDDKYICIALEDSCLIRYALLDIACLREETMMALVPILFFLRAKDEKNKKEQNSFLLFPTDIINIIKSILLDLYRIKK
jgi:WD40 repeat protein